MQAVCSAEPAPLCNTRCEKRGWEEATAFAAVWSVSVRDAALFQANKESMCLDRHLKAHTELTVASCKAAVVQMKKQRILKELAALRASSPKVPMVSTLDMREEDAQNAAVQGCSVEEEEVCSRPACILWRQHVADLNEQVDTLTSALKELTQCFKKPQRHMERRPSAHYFVQSVFIDVSQFYR